MWVRKRGLSRWRSEGQPGLLVLLISNPLNGEANFRFTHSGFLRQGLFAAASAARRASSFAFAPGEILLVTQISRDVILATARYEVFFSGFAESSLALKRTIKAHRAQQADR